MAILVKFSISTNKVGSKVSSTFDILDLLGMTEDEWDEYTPEQKRALVQDEYDDWVGEWTLRHWEFVE